MHKILNLPFKKWGHRAIENLHNIYVVAIVLYYGLKGATTNETDKELLFIIVIAVYILLWLAYSLFFSIQLGRKARYSEAFASIHNANHVLRDCYRYLERCLDSDCSAVQLNKETVRTKLVSAMTAVAQAYTMTSSVKCRACLKLIGTTVDFQLNGNGGPRLEDYYVETFARDDPSKSEKKNVDKGEGEKHRLIDNTSFRSLAEMKVNVFYNGNVWKSEYYQNTSYPNKDRTGAPSSPDYTSVIVFPIRYQLSKEEMEDEGIVPGVLGDQVLYGFLAIDAKPTNAFYKRYDIDLGATVADSLFTVLSMYNRAFEQKVKNDRKEKV